MDIGHDEEAFMFEENVQKNSDLDHMTSYDVDQVEGALDNSELVHGRSHTKDITMALTVMHDKLR